MAEGDGEGKATGAHTGTHDVFVSYASQDAALATTVVDALERSGVSCWIAPRDVTPGMFYADEIVGAIDAAKAMVLILSQNAAASQHVVREVERAASKRHPVVSLRIDRAALPPGLAYFLNTSQWLDARGEDIGRSMPKLVAAVRLATEKPVIPNVSMAAPGAAGTPSHKSYPSSGDRSRRHIAIVVGSLVGLAIAGVAVYRFWQPESRPIAPTASTPAASTQVSETVASAIPERSVAVLPFVDMSEKKDQEYFADGMAEEIIDLLAKVPNLHVPARTSSFYFKNKPTKIPDIARELGVANVLEGSVRRSGNHLRVTAQLVRADNAYHMWSETYDRDLRDVFKVQDEIANAVVQALQISLMGGPLTRPKGGTQNLQAYQLYLRALSASLQNTDPSLELAGGYLEQAIKLDPNFGLAWSALAINTIVETDGDLLNPKEGYERARQLAQRALQLSPDLADAHAALQYVHRTYDWDWAASEREGRLALSLDPTNSSALMFTGLLSVTLGHWDDAVRQLRSALARDPLDTYVNANLGDALYSAGRYAEAETAYRRVVELAPQFWWAPSSLAKILVAEGRPEAALAMLQQDVHKNDRLLVLPIVLQAVGRTAEADEELNVLIASHADSLAYWIAAAYAYRGDHDLALQWLDRAYKAKDANLVYLVGEPLFKNVASDPRYKAFLRKMNLPESPAE